MTRKRFVKLCMGRLGMSRNRENCIARNRDFVYTLTRTSLAINAAASAFNAMSVAMADLARALDEVR